MDEKKKVVGFIHLMKCQNYGWKTNVHEIWSIDDKLTIQFFLNN
jgi:hypothetical protein